MVSHHLVPDYYKFDPVRLDRQHEGDGRRERPQPQEPQPPVSQKTTLGATIQSKGGILNFQSAFEHLGSTLGEL